MANATDPSGLDPPLSPMGPASHIYDPGYGRFEELDRVNRQIYLKKINDAQAMHQKYAYYETMKLNHVFRALKDVADYVSIRPKHFDGDVGGEYGEVANTIYYPNECSFDNVRTDTVIHEAIHAMDDHFDWNFRPGNYWNLRNSPEFLDRAEALAYAAIQIIGIEFSVTRELRTFEDRLRRGDYQEYGIENEIQRDWELVWDSYLKYTRGSVHVVNVWYGHTPDRPITPHDYQQMFHRFRIRFKIRELTDVYNRVLEETGHDCRIEVPNPNGNGYLKRRILK